jgi:hypothetical protein
MYNTRHHAYKAIILEQQNNLLTIFRNGFHNDLLNLTQIPYIKLKLSRQKIL